MRALLTLVALAVSACAQTTVINGAGGGGGAPSGSAGGDLSATYPNPTVAKVNGTLLSGLATGLLKNTTSTGVPSIAAFSDFLAMSGLSGTASSSTLLGGDGNWKTISSGFDAITNGMNTTATMTVGSGASIAVSGSGSVNATKVNGSTPGGTCTSQVVTAISSSAIPTCTTIPIGSLSASLANSSVSAGGGAVQYGSFGQTTFNGTEGQRQVASGITGTLKNFYVVTTSTQSGVGSLVCAVRTASLGSTTASNTSIIATVAAGATANVYSDTTDTASVTAGQLISVGCTNNGSGASAAVAGWGLGMYQ